MPSMRARRCMRAARSTPGMKREVPRCNLAHQLLRARAAGRRRVVLLRVSVQVGGAPEPPTVACEGGRATTRGARVCAARPRANLGTHPHPLYVSAGATCLVVCSQPQLFPEISEYYYLTHRMEATDREGRRDPKPWVVAVRSVMAGTAGKQRCRS